MLRGLRNRSSTRRSQVVSSSDEEEYTTGSTVVKQPPDRVKDSNKSHSSHKHPEPSLHLTESQSTVSLSSSSDGSMFSSESPSIDDDKDHDKLAHESYLNGTIPDLEEILRSFGNKSRRLNARSSRYNESSSILDTPALLDTGELDEREDDRNSNNSSYNSGFSSSSDSSFESIPDTTQLAAFYNGCGESPLSSLETTFVTWSPTSTTTDIHQFSSECINESSPRKAVSSSRKKSKRQRRRSEQRMRRRLTKMDSNASNTTCVGDDNFNDKDIGSRQSFLSRTNSLINTSKTFGKNWTRKKRIDQIDMCFSDSENKEKLLSVEPVNHNESASTNGTPSFTLSQENITLKPTNAALEMEPARVAPNNIVKKVMITKSKLSQVIERFDCDTGERITDFVVESGVVIATDRSSKRSHSPTSLPVANNERQVDPLALPEIKLIQELSDNDSPQKSCGSSGNPVVNYSISNAANVIENMILLFAKSDVEGIRRLLGESLESSVSSLSTSSSSFGRNIVFDSSIDEGIDIEDDGSDDEGGSDKQKAKHLRTNKSFSMKGGYKQASKKMQGLYTLNDYTLPLSMRGIVTHYSLSILLIEPIHKVFEIVTVDVTRNMSLKETLVNACTAAADPILAEQTYISLCSDVKVLSNMASPVSKLIQKLTDLNKKDNLRTDGTTNIKLLDHEKLKEALKRREMERQLLVAVPLRSNSKECQMIRRMLWKNSKLQLWWTTYQMKNEHFVTPWSTSSTAPPVTSALSSSMRFPQPVAI